MLIGPRFQYDNRFNYPIEEMHILNSLTDVATARIFSHQFMQHVAEFRSILRAQLPGALLPVYDVCMKVWHEVPGEEAEEADWARKLATVRRN